MKIFENESFRRGPGEEKLFLTDAKHLSLEEVLCFIVTVLSLNHFQEPKRT